MIYFFAIALLAYLGCIAFIRWRNRQRLPLVRQLSDFSTFMVPFNLPAYGLSQVPTDSQLDKQLFPQLQLLEEQWQTIRDEAVALFEQGLIKAKEDLPASSFYKDNRWTSFYLKLYDHHIPSAHALAPKTMALLQQLPNLNLALFAVLLPGKQLNRHHDPFAYTLRYSLGLSTPNDPACGLTVNGEDYIWRDGESIIFDETYLHSAYNHTDRPRIILMTDIDRPLKSAWLQKLYWRFGRFFNGLFMIDNLDPSYSGKGNQWGKGLLAYSRALKAVKKKNRRLYYLLKWSFMLVLLAALLWWLW